MGDIEFIPILDEITSEVNNLLFSTVYYGIHCERNCLLIKHQTKSLMVVLKNEKNWKIDFYTNVSSRDKSIKSGLKIDGCQNTIVLLDDKNKMWKLINAFEFSNEKDECLYLIDEKCFYEWVPIKKFNEYKVFDITATKNGFACLFEHNKKKFLQIFSCTNFNLLEDFTFDMLNATLSQNYYLKNISSNELNSDANNSLIICNRLDGKVSLHTGKDDCYTVATSKCIDYVCKNVVCIEKCYCSESSCVVWSDGVNINHTNIHFNFEKSNFATLKNLKVKHNIMGVKLLIRVADGLIAVTTNNFYYYIMINKEEEPEEEIESLDDILSKIMDGGLKINSLNKKIDLAANYLQFKELMQSNTLKDQVELIMENNILLIKMNSEHVFKKDLWKLRQSSFENKKFFVEMTDLETDLTQGITLKINIHLVTSNPIELFLIGDFGSDFNLLTLYLGKVNINNCNKDKNKFESNLLQLAKKRNPYFKE
ncbi:hypothetical protein Phum_PHUM156230 [Pediculus humanus corporis]|uniref:Uncharacterized protein n=1 Tax=Pediculus humanus subsp. corporis TaxID=121224 RepID=E0VFE8_PEDHC|nr:uncharacterized protein Phum_PHUM156230 [Pediculus humanus corporis]EEB12104.1 hypothetical protein Phum_PHUM156230 [Pediculus humanus corporis]